MKKYFSLIIILLSTNLVLAQYFQDTKGELNITNAGTASYTVPIAMPPSINNSAPVINLTYSSGVRGGIAGKGWNISSISSITRISTRIDIDGYVDGVDFDENDKLALDGQRLILKSGIYWQNDSTYETEYKSNTKIELKIEGIHTYFIVTSPDGSRTWYGSTGNGVIQNATSLNSWYVIRNEDVYGNYITYVYAPVTYNNTNQLYIDSILFSGNEGLGLNQINKIKFNYVNSARVERDFIKNSQSYASKILDNIEVLTNSVLFRKYQLTRFAPDESGYERVQSIQEFNGLNEPSNPVVFEYYNTPLSTTRTQRGYINNLAFNDINLSGDFDGDGRIDFISENKLFTNLFNNTVSNFPISMPFSALTTTSMPLITFGATTIANGKINQFQSIVKPIALNDGLTFNIYNLSGNTLNLSYSKTVNLGVPNPMLGFPHTFAKLLEGDYNGDGISEVLIISSPAPQPPPPPDDPCHWYGLCGMADIYTNFHILDLNPNSSVSSGSPGLSRLSSSIMLDLQTHKNFVSDFNGDGKSDILSINNLAGSSDYGKYKIFSFNKINVSPWVEPQVIGYGLLDAFWDTKQMLFGDFNGDGKTDIMLPDTLGGSGHTLWHIYYSNPNPIGGSFFLKESHNIVEYWPDTGSYYNMQTHWSNYYAMDVNKDGKSDLVRVWRKYHKPAWTINDHDTNWSVSAYTNNLGVVGVNGFVNTYFSGEYSSNSPDVPIPIASNFKYNNANTDLVIIRGHFNKIEYYQFNKNFDSDNRLKSVTESNGNVKNTIEYLPMIAQNASLGNSQTDFYSSSESENYPNIEIIKNENNFLVSKLIATVNGVSKFQDFRYRGFVSNFIYGSIGFKRTTRSGWYLATTPSNEKIWSTSNNDSSLRGANTITWTSTNGNTVFDATPTDLISTKTSNFTTHIFNSSKLYNVLLESQTEINAVTGVKIESLYTYDGTVDVQSAYGLRTSLTTNTYNGTVLQGTTTVSTPIAEYDNNPTGQGNTYYIGKPKRISTTTTIYPNTPNADTRTSEEKYTYSGPNISKIEKKGHNTDYIVTDMTYDEVGNLLTKMISMPSASPAIASRTVTDAYDPTKRFVITKTDHQGFVTQLEYNNLGQVKKSTSYLGAINEIFYDNWGKVTQSKTFNSSTTPLITTTSYLKLANGGYTVTATNTSGDNAMTRTEFDVLGRIVKQTSKGFAVGSEISKSIEYDALGRKYRESEPFFSSPSKWTTFQYDYLSRPIQITQFTNRIQIMSYVGLTATTVDDGVTRSSTLDSMGNKIRTTDPGGIIEFFYYATGQLRKTKYIDNEITIGIDGWGNKTSMNDPNAGLYSYTYDAFGQLKTEVTPKGTTTYFYDDFGKLINKSVIGDGADFNTQYTYNSFAQLETEISKTAANLDIDNYGYTYDNYHRLSGTLENNAYLEHTKTIIYDSYGRVASETNYTREKTSSNFSATFTHKMVYNTYNGLLYKVTDNNNTMLWELNSANEKMQTLTATLGNGVSVTNTYDSNYYFTSQQHRKNSIFLVNSNYVFDNVKGNLTSRQNLAPGIGISENFTYDNLDRLQTWSNPVTSVIDTNVYDARGRITDNNKLGNIRYNTNAASGVYKKTAVKLNTEGLAYYNALGGNQQISYTMFKTPISINESNKGKIDFTYNSHLGRNKMLYDYGLIGSSTTKVQRKTKLYTNDGTTEIIYDTAANTIKIITFIAGDAYSALVYNEKIKNNNSNVTTDNNYYLHRDYLGSIIAISDSNGVAIEKRHFDAWGNLAKIVNNANVSLPLSNGLVVIDRGYTSHEHLQEVRLIHMNGRLYDPVLKSFLMPDNFVQQPENSQNYNRYAYCFNNPLRHNDPSGEEGITLGIAVIIAVAVAVTSYTLNALLRDVPFTVGGLLKTTYIAAATAVVTFGIGDAAGSMFTNFYSQASFQAVSHGFVQGSVSGLQGGKFWSGFAAGAVSSIASSVWVGVGPDNGGWHGLGGCKGSSNVGMIAFGTVSGGVSAKLTGGNFWQGAVAGLFVSALNHAGTHNRVNSKKIFYSRFKKDSNGKYIVDPEGMSNFTQAGTDSLLENVEGLAKAYKSGGSKPVKYDWDVEGDEGFTDTSGGGSFRFNKQYLTENWRLVSAMFHEFRHGLQYWGTTQLYNKWSNDFSDPDVRWWYMERDAYRFELRMGSPSQSAIDGFNKYNDKIINFENNLRR